MIESLLRLVDDAGALHNRLILLVGGSPADRSALLAEMARQRQAPVLALGIELSRQLLLVPRRQRPLQAARLLQDVVAAAVPNPLPAALDRIAVLFDRSLQLDPVDALRRLSHARTVVANWPGEIRDGRLTYAPANHPEHRSSPTAGLVLFQLH